MGHTVWLVAGEGQDCTEAKRIDLKARESWMQVLVLLNHLSHICLASDLSLSLPSTDRLQMHQKMLLVVNSLMIKYLKQYFK